MRFVWLIFVGLVAAMFLVIPRLSHRKPSAPTISAALPVRPVAARTTSADAPPPPRQAARADSVIAFGLAQKGTPYVYAGTSPLTGFDCSGFIMYTFAHFGVAVPHSTALLIDVGRPVARAEAQPGDIVVFTGTAKTSTTPGHAGIVVSRRGEVPLRFVHASSSRREPFVKESQVEDSDYERRFMQVRRVLGSGEVTTTRPKEPVPATMNTPVTKLKTRPVAVAKAVAPTPKLPTKLPTKKYPRKSASSTAHRKTSGKAPATVKKSAISTKGKRTYKTTRTSAKKRSTH